MPWPTTLTGSSSLSMISSPHCAHVRLVRKFVSSRCASEARAVLESSPFFAISLVLYSRGRPRPLGRGMDRPHIRPRRSSLSIAYRPYVLPVVSARQPGRRLRDPRAQPRVVHDRAVAMALTGSERRRPHEIGAPTL